MLLALTGVSGRAQNLNPTVEVTNDYQASLLQVNKPVDQMMVPDSVQRFNLDFDYSVFDSPYQGAYTFSPYEIDMRPQADAYKGRKLYLRAGAGYALKPTVDVVYSPFNKGRFHLNLYGSHGSYFGNYKNIYPVLDGGTYKLKTDQPSALKEKHKGHDMLNKAGVNGTYDWKKAALTFDLGYLGIQTKDTLAKTSMNVFNASLGFKAKGERTFHYDASFSFKGGNDGVGDLKTKFNEIAFGGTFGPSLGNGSKVLVDVNFALNSFGSDSAFDHQSMGVDIAPHYVFTKGRWDISLGAKLNFATHSEHEGIEALPLRKRIVTPDAMLSYALSKEHLSLYVRGTGGNTLRSYLDLKDHNHFYNSQFGGLKEYNSFTKYDISLGVRGNIAQRFRFDIRGGYASYLNALLDGVKAPLPLSFSKDKWPMLASVISMDYDAWYAGVNIDWDGDPIYIKAAVNYMKSSDLKDEFNGFEPASVAGDFYIGCIATRRLRFGLGANFASARKGYFWEETLYYATGSDKPGYSGNFRKAEIPSFLDLRANAEYSLTRKLSVWLQCGNLLNADIQRTPLYTEPRINFTAGLCLNL